MSIFQKIKGILGLQKPVEDFDADIDEVIKMMNTTTLDERQTIDKVQLKSDGDVNTIIEKLEKERIVVVDMSNLLRNKEKLVKLIKKLTGSCKRMKWQICRISNEIILVTPNNIRINMGV